MGSFTSLESASAVGPGESRQLQKATAHHTMIVSIDGTPTNVVVTLEGSHDGFRWVPIATHQAQEDGIRTTPPTTHLVTFVRANLVAISGDNAAKVSASIASADA
jgi:hypothetical protein